MLPVLTDVLIVGAGPTGLALAAALQKGGVDHLLIDALNEGCSTSRAAVVHAHTLEMLEAIDIVEPLTARAMPLSRFTIRDRDQALLALGFEALPSAYRHLLMVPQSTTEVVMQSRLEEMGGRLRRGVSALGATAEPGGAAVRVRTAAGERTIHARYVVGADGMHSVIREAAGIAFRGEAYGASFVLADVRMDWPLGNEEVSLFFSPAGLVVVAPLPDGSFRVVATVDDAPEQPGVEDIQLLLDARGPAAAACRVTSIAWASRFRVHHRLADRYRAGPFLLMGDAAHVHSPAGGQGMNTGLVDAIVLGEALTRVVRDRAPDLVLDDYAQARRPAAQEVLALASRLTRLATMRSGPARRIRNVALRLLNHAPAFKRKLTLALSGLDRRRFSLPPRGGGEGRTNPPCKSGPVQRRILGISLGSMPASGKSAC
jgi:2-polyprenyl-6-methoxyphenol hydroxylase-like FAD-dependent oxidoreductase